MSEIEKNEEFHFKDGDSGINLQLPSDSFISKQLKEMYNSPVLKQVQSIYDLPVVKEVVKSAEQQTKIMEEMKESRKRMDDIGLQSLRIEAEKELKKNEVDQAVLDIADHVVQLETQYNADMDRMQEERKRDKEDAAQEQKRTRRSTRISNIIATISLIVAILSLVQGYVK